MSMARQFRTAETSAAALQTRLRGIQRMLLVGGITAGAGLGIFAALEKTMKPGSEYLEALNRLHMAGLSQVEVAQAVNAAWKNTGDVITTTATANLSAMQDLRNILGSMKDATWALPIVTKIGTAMASSSESSLNQNSSDIAFSMAKALDIIGAAKDPATFEREAGLMSKVVTAFQNRVTPKQFQSVFQYARQAKFDLSDQFKYEFLPTLMLEMSGSQGGAGGGSRGVGPMLAAIYRVTNQGYINKKAIPILEKLGLLTDHNFTRTTTADTVGSHLKGADLAAQNPFLWNQQVLVPAIKAAYGQNVTPEQVRNVINMAFRGNQLAAAAMVEFASKPQNFMRDQKIIQGAMPYDQAYQAALKNDPRVTLAALKAQWTNFITTVGVQVTKDAMTIGTALLPVLHELAVWAHDNPKALMGWVHGFEMLGTALTVGGGAVLLGAVAKGLKLVLDLFKIGGAAGAATTGMTALTTALGGLSLAPFAVIAAGLVALAGAAMILPRILDGLVHDLNAAGKDGKGGIKGTTTHAGHGTNPGLSAHISPYGPHVEKILHGDVYLDGRKVGKMLANGMAEALGGAGMKAGTVFDPRAVMAQPGAPYRP